jgi:PAS domain S-box-containing protein
VPEQPLVLCVDDNEGARYALVRTLQRAGFRTAEATSGAEALQRMADRPDLVVLDVHLPDISGYVVCQRIKSDPRTAGTPVLQISADFVEVEHRTRGLDLGADGYLAHPIEAPELIATIRSLLRARSAEEKARATARELQSTFDAISDPLCLLDVDGRVVRCNQAMTRLLGVPETELIGRGHESFLPATGVGASGDPFRRMTQTRAREVENVQHGDRWLRVICDPVLDDGGALTGAVYIFSDFTERQRAQQEREHLLAREQAARAEAQNALAALKASESRFRRLGDSNVIGVMEASLSGTLLWANDAALRMLGWTREQLEAGLVHWDRATPPEFLEADARAIEELRATGVCTPYDKEYLRPDGSRVPAYVGVAMLDEDRAVAFVLDLSVVRGLENQLREKVVELEAADQRKDEFLAMLAHELRNPLAAVTSGLHVLDEVGSRDQAPVRTRATLLRQVGILIRLVDDLLDVSRITRGKVDLRREPVRLRDAVEHAVGTARPLMEERRHELGVEIPDDPLWAMADGTRVEQVISNLINNAAKYTEPGGSITVGLRRQGDSALLSVRDTGIGIDPPMLDRVFELFAQVDQSPARSRGGLGVGLTLVRNLVEMHGGTVCARSAGLGKGSEFEVRLPLLREEAHALEERREVADPGRRRLLLVEDNPDIGETLRDLLELLGHRVELAGDGLRGVQIALATQPDAALVDIGLPGIDGYEVARRLRATEKGKEMVLVALTGYGRPEDRDRALESGFDAHLVKPVDPDELNRLLASLVGARAAGRAGMSLRE